MAILLTGATGHLGPHLIAELLRLAHVDRLYVVARDGAEPARSRVQAIERIARAQLAAEGSTCTAAPIMAVDLDRLRDVRDTLTVIVHAAADTRFAAPIDLLREANVEGTRALCRMAATCRDLRQLLFVSTACVAGRRTGRIPERVLDDSAGFANAYEQTKWEAEQVVVSSGLPARIARLSTCAGSHATGYVHRFGALHQLLHWMSRGLVPMVPGTAATPVDIISTDVASGWIARATMRAPHGLEVCHVALGDNSIPLGTLLDCVGSLLDEPHRSRVAPPLIVDEKVFRAFSDMVRLSGDALMASVHASAAAVLPSLMHPKVYETTGAERCWGGPLPHPDWRSLLSRVAAFGRTQRWGARAAEEVCHE